MEHRCIKLRGGGNREEVSLILRGKLVSAHRAHGMHPIYGQTPISLEYQINPPPQHTLVTGMCLGAFFFSFDWFYIILNFHSGVWAQGGLSTIQM